MEQKPDQKDFISCYPVWKEALTGEHKGIWIRVVQAWHDYLFYRSVCKCFAEAEKTPVKDGLPYGLMNAYHHTFYRSAMVELRSAIGGPNDTLFDSRGEHSLRAVLSSIAATKITRAKLFEANKIDYEFKTKQLLDEEEFRSFIQKQGSGFVPSTYAGWRFSSDLHLTVDKLTATNEHNRSPDDVIPSNIFTDAGKELDKRTQKLTVFINKHIAHAATAESIKVKSQILPSRIEAQDLEDAYGALAGTFDFLASELFCWADYSFNLDVSYKLEGVEKAFGLTKGSANLKMTYREFSDKFNQKLRKWRPIPSAE